MVDFFISFFIVGCIRGHSSSYFLIQKVIQKWKKYIDLFLEPRSLPESDGHRDHGGIGGSKNKYFFLIVFQRLMP